MYPLKGLAGWSASLHTTYARLLGGIAISGRGMDEEMITRESPISVNIWGGNSMDM
jgi:hypothetical protein